jgi:hypothetical protein
MRRNESIVNVYDVMQDGLCGGERNPALQCIPTETHDTLQWTKYDTTRFYLRGSSVLDSKLYLSHSPTALKLSHLTLSSASCMSSITLAFRPSFSNCCLFSGTSLTRHATSLHPIANTCLSFSQLLDKISASFFGSSPLLSSRILRALSRQKVGLR